MKIIYQVLFVLVLVMTAQHIQARGSAIKIEFDGTSMSVELSEKPSIIMENGNLVLKTASMSVALSLPCKTTFINDSDVEDGLVKIRNNDEDKPIHVFTLGGQRVATLNKKSEVKCLQRGVYIINGKKMIIK